MTDSSLLPAELQLIAAFSLLLLLARVIRLIRCEELGLRESLLWLVSTAVALTFVLFPPLLVGLAAAAHVKVPSNALFALGFLYVLVNLLSVTIAVSRNSAQARRLSQECAMLRAELEQLRGRRELEREP